MLVIRVSKSFSYWENCVPDPRFPWGGGLPSNSPTISTKKLADKTSPELKYFPATDTLSNQKKCTYKSCKVVCLHTTVAGKVEFHKDAQRSQTNQKSK